jgi:hypothetical protein
VGTVLRVTPDRLNESSQQAAGAATGTVPAAQVTPAAADPVSVSVAQVLGTKIAMIGAQTQTTHAQTQQAAARLNVNAADYATQEQAGTSGLGFGAAPAAVTPAPLAMPTPVVPPQIPAPQAPITPTTGKQIAELIHGGPGPAPLHDAAARLRSHGQQLATTGSQLRSAATNLQNSWFSGAGEAAHTRLVTLADTYEQNAQTASATATIADDQAAAVARARNAIPKPEEFDDLERRLVAAQRANATPPTVGMYAPVIAQLQSQLAELNAKATAGYADYTTDSEAGNGQIQAVDWKTEPPPRDGGDKKDDTKDDDKNGHGGSKSVGKGSKTHIEPKGDVEQQWGTPTDPHQWGHGQGQFDNGRGSWELQGPGWEGGAHAEQHTDGISGEAKAGAWIGKANVDWSGDAFGHPMTANGNAGIGIHGDANGALTDHGVGANVDAFAGAEIGGKLDYDLGPVDLSLDASARFGAGATGGFDFGMQDGKLVFGGSLGGAWGPGGKIAPHIAIDPKTLTDGLKTITNWVDGLF